VFRKPAITVVLFVVSAILMLNCIAGCGNQKLAGRAFYYENRKSCTKMLCKCCNDCESDLFLIAEQDTIQLYGIRTYSGIRSRWKIVKNDTIFFAETLSTTKNKQPLVFFGKECEKLKNTQFEVGKSYEIKGGFLPQGKGPLGKAFNVVDYKMVK
jgi:hypothetical protein